MRQRESSPQHHHHHHHNSDHRDRDVDSRDERRAGYGLQGGAVACRPAGGGGGSGHDLGPDPELLQRKRSERESERRRLHESTHRRRHRTAAERQAALQAYQEDAARHAAQRDRHVQRKRQEDDKEEKTSPPSSRSAAFLHEVTQQAHGITKGEQSMSERLRQNRSTNQRSNDAFL